MITEKQKIWLHSRGGRTEDDVVWIDSLPYVQFRNLVSLPKDKDISDTLVQNNSKDKFRHILILGKTLKEWASIQNLEVSTLYTRIFRYGWEFEKAVNTPVKQISPKLSPTNIVD